LPSPLLHNLARVRTRIDGAALAAGRRPEDVRLVAVTKAVDVARARELCELGVRDLGENRASELERKALALEALTPTWHFIGHLQRNKVRRVLRHATWIHAVDSERLLEALERAAGEEGARPRVLLQLDLTGESNKHGMSRSQLTETLGRCGALVHLRLSGLMAMGPLRPRPGRGASEVFAELADIAGEIERDPQRSRVFEGGRVLCSMGMSGDFESAVRAGSHMVRVGSALFEGSTDKQRERA
jgi:pyridoxal phosphate enzyme (YggS family)